MNSSGAHQLRSCSTKTTEYIFLVGGSHSSPISDISIPVNSLPRIQTEYLSLGCPLPIGIGHIRIPLVVEHQKNVREEVSHDYDTAIVN